ncbi:hypothetical protein V6N13_019007 [Hibiscus sabdariffa]
MMVSHGDQVEHISGLEPDVSMGDGLTLDESSRIEYLAYNVSKGGIVMIWEISKFDFHSLLLDPYFNLVRGSWHFDNWCCAMISMYAPFELGAQLVLLSSLTKLVLGIVVPVVVVGFIDGMGLVDFLTLDKFGGLEQHTLPRGISNHSSVQLSSGVVD